MKSNNNILLFYHYYNIIMYNIILLRPIHSHEFSAAFRTQTRIRGHNDIVAFAKFYEFRLLEV